PRRSAQPGAPKRDFRRARKLRRPPRGPRVAQHHLPHSRRPLLHHRFRIRHAPRRRERRRLAETNHRSMSTPDGSAATPPPPAEPPPDASTRVRWSGLTHVGRFRPNNEDAFLALNLDAHVLRYLGRTGEASLAGPDFVFAVSDGMGGAKSGEFASRITVDRVSRLLPRAFRLRA